MSNKISSYRDCFFSNGDGSGNNDQNNNNNNPAEETNDINSMLWFKKCWFSEMALLIS